MPLLHFSKLHLQKLFIVFSMILHTFAKDQHIAHVCTHTDVSGHAANAGGREIFYIPGHILQSDCTCSFVHVCFGKWLIALSFSGCW